MGPPGGKKIPPNYPPTPVLPPSRHDNPSSQYVPNQQYHPTQNTSQHIPMPLPQSVIPRRSQSPTAVEDDELPVQAQHDEYDNVDGRGGARLRVRPERVNVNVSYERAEAEVTESTPNLLTSFIVGRMESDGYDVPHELRQRRVERDVAQVLQKIGDDLHNNKALNFVISELQVTPQTAYKTFAQVAGEIFLDGNINWGRIVMLFYFAYKLALQSLKSIDLIDLIISWVQKFVAEKLARWIAERGGWTSVREYFGSTTGQLIGVFIAGIVVASIFNWWWRR